MRLLSILRSAPSTVRKRALIANIDFNEWRTFVFAYEPNSMYGMKLTIPADQEEGEPTDEMFDLLERIINKKLRGNAAKLEVNNFAVANGSLIKKIINKNLECGVSATLFNKVHAGSISQFLVQLAKEVDIKAIAYPVLAQLKYDGVRLVVKIKNGKASCFTRNGKSVDLPDLQAEIEKLPYDNYMLDGEVTMLHGKQVERTSISGKINSAIHGTTIDETDIVYHVFDTLPLAQFETCTCNLAYADRFGWLNNILSSYGGCKLELARTSEVHSYDALQELYAGAIAVGYEGLILKYPNHMYTFRRSADWIKLKETKSVELTCYDIKEGEGKYHCMIGALMCKGTVEGKDITVSVGSGLSDVQRSLAFSYYTGQTIEVKYNAVITDSRTGKHSLFLPRFVAVRFDK